MKEVPRNIDRSPWSRLKKRILLAFLSTDIAMGCGLCLLAIGFLLYRPMPPLPLLCLTALYGLLMVKLGYCEICSLYARFSFSDAGVTVKYPLQKIKTIEWNAFQQVCICYGYHVRDNGSATVICCIKKGEKKDIFDRWKTDSPFHYRSVIGMFYTQELLDEIERACPMKIVDLRETPAYKYY